MQLYYQVRFLFFWIILLTATTVAYSQISSFQRLEQQVYQLNNELKYNQSQAILLPVLRSDTYSADDKYQAALLLSYTYKRVFDYQSTLKFLRIAQKYAKQTQKRDQYIAMIRSEEAFVFFDTHAYQKAGHLMTLLERNDFRYISLENKSKLVMQQGYLLFLNRRYSQAEATYDRAIRLMQASAPCHLPMIFVKKMQLYEAMDRLDLMNGALKKSNVYADSCRIIKYNLYAYEELLHIYKSRNDIDGIAQTQKKLDSLNQIYAREENAVSLHNQKENILLEDKDRELRREQTDKEYLTAILIGLFLTALILLGWLLFYRRQQRRIEAEFLSVKIELETYLSQSRGVSENIVITEEEPKNGLSERQQEVLECMATGMSNKMIADKLFISENTVKYHIKNIYQLLEIKDRKQFLVTIKR